MICQRIAHAMFPTFLLFAIAGCKSYEPAPVDLEAHSREWSERALDPLLDFESVNAIDPSGVRRAATARSFNARDGIDLAEAELLVLVANPGLRMARASAGVGTASAREAGRLDDPELNFDALRILESIDKPWILGGGVSFTLPLSGRLAVEKQAASADAQVGWCEALSAEQAAIAELRQLWCRWAAATMRADLLDRYLAGLEEILAIAQNLATHGELASTNARVFRIERASRRAEAMRARAEAAALAGEIKEHLGIVPDAPLTLASGLVLPGTSRAITDKHAAIMRHPEMALALARFTAAEHRLELEVRRQYPDLTIGPGYENEQGQSRIELGLGIPVPVFNGNAQGIAEAEAAREAQRVAVESTYETLAHRGARALESARRAVAVSNAIDAELEPLVAEQITEIRKLADLGELDVLLVQEALASSLAAKVEALESRQSEASALWEVENVFNAATAAEVDHE